jgi:polyhydroxyalkanoate synthase
MEKIAGLENDKGASRYNDIDEEGIFRLLRYEAPCSITYRTPILIVYAWINRPYVLDLRPEISVVKKYLEAGFDTYIIDWGYPTAVDRYLDLDDYVDFLDKSIELIKRRTATHSVNIHGYCLGGTLSAVYAAMRPSNVKNLLLQAAPIDFHTDNPLVLWSRALDPQKIEGAFGVASGDLMNVAFLLADPVNLIMAKYEGFLNRLDSDAETANFLSMDQWVFDSPAIPGATFRQYVTDWYHHNLLTKGEFEALGERVDLHKITAPLLVLVAQHDHIVPPSAQKAILGIASSQDKAAYEMSKGHIGITTSRDAHKEFWPGVLAWLEKRSDALPARPTTGGRRVRTAARLPRPAQVASRSTGERKLAQTRSEEPA